MKNHNSAHWKTRERQIDLYFSHCCPNVHLPSLALQITAHVRKELTACTEVSQWTIEGAGPDSDHSKSMQRPEKVSNEAFYRVPGYKPEAGAEWSSIPPPKASRHSFIGQCLMGTSPRHQIKMLSMRCIRHSQWFLHKFTYIFLSWSSNFWF
jgi:hypothetical protein